MKKPETLLGLGVDIDDTTYGWACIRIQMADRTVEILDSDCGRDALGELALALESLVMSPLEGAEVNAYDEIGADIVQMRRRDEVLELTVKRLDDECEGVPSGLIRRYHDRRDARDFDMMNQAQEKYIQDKPASLHCAGSFIEVVGSVVASFDSLIERLGPEKYKELWVFGIPKRPLVTLRRFLTEATE